jgi:hypothetical protein
LTVEEVIVSAFLGVVLDPLLDVTPVAPLLLLVLVEFKVGNAGKVAAPVIIVVNVLVFDVDVEACDATNLD